MKLSAIRALRKKLSADQPVFGLWVTLEAPSITEMAVALGLDWVVIDAEHGHLDWKEIAEHLRATARSETVALVRIAQLDGGLIKRALDIGADGVVVPWVETAEQLQEAVAWSRFPPEGKRGIGGERATAWGQCLVDHTRDANDHVLVVPIIETVTAARNIESLAAVDGVELCYFGPADFSSTAGHRGHWEGPGVAEQIVAACEALGRAGRHCGVIATSGEDLRRRIAQGFRMIGLGMDAGLMAKTLRGLLADAGRPMRYTTDFSPARDIVHVRPQEVTPIELADGVFFRPLIGKKQGVDGLTAGTVSFAPGAALPHHLHTFTEAITVLKGESTVDVEGRRHRLRPYDTLTVPPQIPHLTRNAGVGELQLHIAMSTSTPSRELVDRVFEIRELARDEQGPPGREWVTRHDAARSTDSATTQLFGPEFTPVVTIRGERQMLPMYPAGYGLFVGADTGVTAIDGESSWLVDGQSRHLATGESLILPAGSHVLASSRGDRPCHAIFVRAIGE